MPASAFALARHDLLLEWRTRELASSALLLAVGLVLAAGIALSTSAAASDAASAVFWTASLFVVATLVTRAFGREFDHGTMEALLLLPVERMTLYGGKVASTLAVALSLEAVVFLGYAALFGFPVSASQAGFVLLAILGTTGLVAVGSALSVLAAQARSREALLPVLLIPLALPVLLAAVPASARALSGMPVSGLWQEIAFLAGYGVLFLAASALLFETAVEG